MTPPIAMCQACHLFWVPACLTTTVKVRGTTTPPPHHRRHPGDSRVRPTTPLLIPRSIFHNLRQTSHLSVTTRRRRRQILCSKTNVATGNEIDDSDLQSIVLNGNVVASGACMFLH
ncbi:hypothetical protein PISMIDRAFT_431626 [Pisolithus microcarpus 441]|uniref:Uncharacterized protein n=1 Tax=Pisolithus microcarpus 441 TaxID=765257 RepID=A0A0C9Z425_9AGAM|nr:hypothetical protein PISMIDRAFT_431626 [Pisolithus microcarpus 441]